MAEFAQILIRAKDETKTAFDSAARNMRSLESGAAKLSGLLSTLGVGAGLSVVGLAAFAKSGIDAADGLNDMSQRLGVSVKDLASFKLAAEQSGTNLDSVGKGIQKLTLSIGQAEQGLSTQAKALKTLGITSRDSKEAFFQLADAVASSNDPIKTNAALNDVLGKRYAELLPLLSQGGDALRESARQSETFSEAMARLAPDADKFNDQLATLKINAAGAAAGGLVPLVKGLNEVFDRIKLVKDLIGAGGLFNTIAITAGTSEISTVMRRLKDDIKETQAAIEGEKAKGKDASPFEEKLRGFNAQLEVMKKNSRAAALALGEQFKNYKIPQIPGVPDKPAPTGNGPDLEAMRAEDIASAWKQADDELKQYSDDRDFVRKGDLERDNAINAIAQDWKDAGAALTNEMMTPMEKANVEFGRLQELLDKGVISWETYTRAVFKTQDAISKTPAKLQEMDGFAKKFAENAQDTFADFFKNFDQGTDGMLKKFGATVKGLIANAVAADLTKKLFGGLADNGATSGSGWAGSALNWIGDLLKFDGGGYTGDGARAGGIDGKGGFLAVMHPRETVVDHTRGQSAGGGNTYVVHVHGSNNAPEVRRAAGQGMREALGLMGKAERYV